jgi:succinoglycan biosynthesis protein ExoM
MFDPDDVQKAGGHGLPRVDVCVCTFRRASVVATLESLAAQDLPGRPFRVIVCDNDETPSARALVEEAGRRLGLALTYIHAPARNISTARNACLDAVQAPLMAFIDDDETAAPGWLRHLAACLEASGADVAFGPVQAVYPPDAPAWARTADLHSLKPTVLKDGTIATGYTCNVMLRREAAGPLRFDPELGRTGGEDTTFFDQMGRSGAAMVYCPEALVSEPAPAARTRLAWLLRRSFRSGQTHGRLLLEHGKGRVPQIGLAAAKAGYSLGQAAVHCRSAAGWRRALMRGALHVGVVARLMGLRELRLY